MEINGITYVNVADTVNPETGKTYRQENSERVHKFELGSKVRLVPNPYLEYAVRSQYDGLVLFVVEQTRDCDQTPLYSLSWMTPQDVHRERLRITESEKQGWTIEAPDATKFKLRLFAKVSLNTGIAEQYLELVEGPVEPSEYED